MRGKLPFDRPKVYAVFGSEAQSRIFALIKTLNLNAKDVA